MTLNDRIAR